MIRSVFNTHSAWQKEEERQNGGRIELFNLISEVNLRFPPFVVLDLQIEFQSKCCYGVLDWERKKEEISKFVLSLCGGEKILHNTHLSSSNVVKNVCFLYLFWFLGQVFLMICHLLISISYVLDMTWHQTDGLKSQGYLERLLSTPHMALLHWMENYMLYHFWRQSRPKLEGYDIIRKEDCCTCKSTIPWRRRGDLSLPGRLFSTPWISILQLCVPFVSEM